MHLGTSLLEAIQVLFMIVFNHHLSNQVCNKVGLKRNISSLQFDQLTLLKITTLGPHVKEFIVKGKCETKATK